MGTAVKPQYPSITQVGKKKWSVDKPIRMFRHGEIFEVEVGFVTDGASVPRIFWPIMPPMSDYTNAAVGHDWLYKTHAVDNRKTADTMFVEMMDYVGVPRWKRRTMYRAVRMFGMFAWKNSHDG